MAKVLKTFFSFPMYVFNPHNIVNRNKQNKAGISYLILNFRHYEKFWFSKDIVLLKIVQLRQYCKS